MKLNKFKWHLKDLFIMIMILIKKIKKQKKIALKSLLIYANIFMI